jgi:hypothetical protein
MQAHIIIDGTVENTIEAESLEAAQAMFPEVLCIDAALGGAIGWRYVDAEFLPPSIDLAALRTAALAKTYTDVDAVVRDAIGNRAEEYKDAAAAARAYAAAGYEGEVDEGISSYALFNPTGEAQANQWAAEQIIARADAMDTAKRSMRSKRFEHQAAMRAASTPEELDAAVAAWDAFIVETRASLGI